MRALIFPVAMCFAAAVCGRMLADDPKEEPPRKPALELNASGSSPFRLSIQSPKTALSAEFQKEWDRGRKLFELPPQPLKLRLLINGAPLARTAVEFVGREYRGLRLTTDDEGRLLIPPEARGPNRVIPAPGVDPNARRLHDVKVRPVQTPPAGGEPGDGDPEGTWVEFRDKLPLSGFEECEIAVDAAELEIGLAGAKGIADDAKVTVILGRTDNAWTQSSWVRVSGKPGSSILFPRLQPGRYRVWVKGAGIAHDFSQHVTLVKTGSLKLLNLQPGRDVRGSVAWTNGRMADVSGNGTLFRDGVQVDPPYNREGGWLGLPFGKYRYRIPPYAERAAAMWALEGRPLRAGAAKGHGGQEVEFELNEKTPMVLDLGTIKLKPEEEKK